MTKWTVYPLFGTKPWVVDAEYVEIRPDGGLLVVTKTMDGKPIEGAEFDAVGDRGWAFYRRGEPPHTGEPKGVGNPQAK